MEDKYRHQNPEGVTFTVDGKLEDIATHELDRTTAEIIELILEENAQDSEGYLYASFDGEDVKYGGRDPFFQSVVLAYAEHRRLVLSPDMIWLKILQGVGRYIADNPEKYRELIVKHQGMKELIIDVGYDPNDPKGRWRAFAQECIRQIGENVTEGFLPLVDAEFSTTGFEEKTAINITVAAILKSYFRAVRRRCVCGIPEITLKGTPADWKQIYTKLEAVEHLGLGWWAADMREIINEFINASEGNAYQSFWQQILVRERPEEFTQGRCIKEPSKIDGWILKFYALDNKEPITWLPYGRHNKSEMGVLPFLTETVDGINRKVEIMQLWAGFVGFTENPDNFEVTPKIGWILVRE